MLHNDMSKYGTIVWEGSPPTKRTPEFEREYDFPYGTTRSAVNRRVEEVKVLNNGMCRLKLEPITFFKPTALRSEPPKPPVCKISAFSPSQHK